MKRITSPTLHCGIQHVPFNGTGRLFGGADRLFGPKTVVDAHYWHTHTYEPLFRVQVLNRYLHSTDDAKVQVRPGMMHALAADVVRHADIILDAWARRFAWERPRGLLRIFIDLERATINREPYVDALGPLDQHMVMLLANRVESQARARGWRVICAPVRPLRPTGMVHARPEWLNRPMPDDFVQKWGGRAMKNILKTKAVWASVFAEHTLPRNETGTHENYAWRQVQYITEQLTLAEANPDEIWWAHWLGEELKPDVMEALFRGLRKGIQEFGHRVPAEHHITITGGWQLLRGIMETPVERLDKPGQGNPGALRLSVPSALTGPTIAKAWNEFVESPFVRVFGT